MIKALCVAALLMVTGAGMATAQSATPSAPAAAGSGGIQSQNIFEVKPDASADPGYAEQTNAQRAAVQPGNNAPMWRKVGEGVTGFSSLPKSQAPEAGNLIQPFVQYPGSRWTNAGEAWRQVRNQWIIPYGGAFLLIVAGAIALFFIGKGKLGHAEAHAGGSRIERFTPFERSAHWANAAAFVVLAISGIVMAFGKFFVLPVIGASLFGWLAYALKTAHNFAGPLFVVSLVVVFFTFVKDNMPTKEDKAWLVKGGGLLSDQEVPSHRFNAGEKIVFWAGVMLLGGIVAGSGLVLDKLLPGLLYERGTMQIAHMVHAVAATMMMAMFLGHIYIGTIGMRGAYKAMKTGYVGDDWAREHHELWYADIQSGKIAAQRSQPEAPGKPIQV
jgi:formate dehydrogenase subunit gamma